MAHLRVFAPQTTRMGEGEREATMEQVEDTVERREEELLTPSEVAKLFRVDPKTVTRWAKAGKLSSIRTLGGHRRYRTAEVRALLEGREPAAG